MALSAAIPGLTSYSATRLSVLVHTREYVLELQARERKLRQLLLEAKVKEAKLAPGSESTNVDTDALLREIEAQLEDANGGNLEGGEESPTTVEEPKAEFSIDAEAGSTEMAEGQTTEPVTVVSEPPRPAIEEDLVRPEPKID